MRLAWNDQHRVDGAIIDEDLGSVLARRDTRIGMLRAKAPVATLDTARGSLRERAA